MNVTVLLLLWEAKHWGEELKKSEVQYIIKLNQPSTDSRESFKKDNKGTTEDVLSRQLILYYFGISFFSSCIGHTSFFSSTTSPDSTQLSLPAAD